MVFGVLPVRKMRPEQKYEGGGGGGEGRKRLQPSMCDFQPSGRGAHCDAINLVIVLTIKNTENDSSLLQTRVNSLGPIGVIWVDLRGHTVYQGKFQSFHLVEH